jgi:YHS domain-containing protein
MKKYLLLCFLVVLVACQKKSNSSVVYVENGYAIDGFDVVAFFEDKIPRKGAVEYAYEWQDATWLFTSATNMEKFIAAPDQFAPQYGGYCAYGCADGHKAPTKAETWTIVNGKLYFNYNLEVKELWMKDQLKLIEMADYNWPEVMHQ